MFYNNYLKVALASPVVYLGKPFENAKEIINIKNKIDKASIIVYPEMSLVGYSVLDLLFNNGFLNDVLKALDYIVENSDEKILIIGAPLLVNGSLYNCACVIQNQEILGIIPKVNLPTYGEFNEARYFSSGLKYFSDPCEISINGKNVPFGGMIFENKEHNVSFGVEICGDLWPGYNPHTSLYHNGAEIIFNLSASPFYLGKDETRRTIVNAASSKNLGAYLYLSNSSTDSTSDLVFETHHIASICGDEVLNDNTYTLDEKINYVDIDLELIKFKRNQDSYRRSYTDMDFLYVNFDLSKNDSYKLEKLPTQLPFVPTTDKECNDIIDITSVALKHRLDYIGINKVVLGISGGLDSTLALLFAYSTFKKYNFDLKNIIAITMPGMGTGSKSKSIAKSLMEKLGVTSKEISIKKEALNHLKMLGHDLETKDVTFENAQARIRTLVLMNTANKEGGIVLGTGDMSEIALGWSTFGGDQLSMFNLNSGLPKTTIKKLVEYYEKIVPEVKGELKKVRNATISPELTGSDQATEDRIGKYEINDFIMYHALGCGASKDRVVYLLKEVFNFNEETSINYYDNFFKRFNRNQYKRLASAEGIKIFKFSLGARGDFKYPGDMK